MNSTDVLLFQSVRPTERGGRRQYDKAWFLEPMPCIVAIGVHRFVATSISFQLSLKIVVDRRVEEETSARIREDSSRL